eukprot:scaffold1.g5252.t1
MLTIAGTPRALPIARNSATAVRRRGQVVALGARDVSSSSACSTSGRALGAGLRTVPDLASTGLASGSPSSSGRSAEQERWVCSAAAGGDGGEGPPSGGGGGGGPGGDASGTGDEGEGEELLSLSEAEELAALKGAALPEDMAAAAAAGGLRKSVLQAYLGILGGGSFFSALLARALPGFRNRLIADRLFLFKILAEVAIDAGCATVAEVRKRGEDFWGEFEFYLSDLVVGLVLDVVLVTLIAPVAVLGVKPLGAAASPFKSWLRRLPSAMFEASQPGRKYTFADRAACYVVKGLEYSLAGIACGFVGQGVANGMMQARAACGRGDGFVGGRVQQAPIHIHLKRNVHGAKEDDVAIPPLVTSALVWGMFMGLSSNTRYQIVFGLERLVAYFTTLAIRFVNNVIGGEQFIDMARWAKIQ